jgi:hypothetical protein
VSESSDAWVGLWKLNVARSKYSPGPPPKSGTLTNTAALGGTAAVVDVIDAEGKPTHVEVTWKFDGKDYPVKGAAVNGMVAAHKRIDSHSFEFTTKVGGKVTMMTKVVLSPGEIARRRWS